MDSLTQEKLSLHVVPKFYGVYLLNSTVKPKSFYIGSTPDPKRRLLQHNGSKIGGAYKTKRNGLRPWKIILLVHGFPSKIAALQFEHSWQHPHVTRHIKEKICKTSAMGNSIYYKLANVRLLLCCSLFRTMDLTVSMFDDGIFHIWNQNKFNICVSNQVQLSGFDEFINGYFPPKQREVSNEESQREKDQEQELDNERQLQNPREIENPRELQNAKELQNEPSQNQLEIEPGSQASPPQSPLRETQEIAYDTASSEFELVKRKILFENHECALCATQIDYLQDLPTITNKAQLDSCCAQVPLISTCFDCGKVYHLTCLAKSGSKLIPTTVSCQCGSVLNWKKLVEIATNLRWYIVKDSFVNAS